MYARIATFEGSDSSQTDRMLEAVRRDIESGAQSPPEGLEGAREVLMLVDRASGKLMGITLFETEEELRRGDEALNRMSPSEGDVRRTNVELYEVGIRKQLG